VSVISIRRSHPDGVKFAKQQPKEKNKRPTHKTRKAEKRREKPKQKNLTPIYSNIVVPKIAMLQVC